MAQFWESFNTLPISSLHHFFVVLPEHSKIIMLSNLDENLRNRLLHSLTEAERNNLLNELPEFRNSYYLYQPVDEDIEILEKPKKSLPAQNKLWRERYQKEFNKEITYKRAYQLQFLKEFSEKIDTRILKFMNKFYNFSSLKYSNKYDLYTKFFKLIRDRIAKNTLRIKYNNRDVDDTVERVSKYFKADMIKPKSVYCQNQLFYAKTELYLNKFEEMFQYYLEDYNKKHHTKYKLVKVKRKPKIKTKISKIKQLQSLNNISKDVLILIALKLDYGSILNLCEVSKQFKDELCDNNYFWKLKYEKDFGKEIDAEVCHKLELEEQDYVIPLEAKAYLNKFYNYSLLQYHDQRLLYENYDDGIIHHKYHIYDIFYDELDNRCKREYRIALKHY